MKSVAGTGSAVPANFTLTAACAAGPCSGSIGGAGGVSSTTIVEGTYTLTDVASGANNSSNYTKGTWSCTGTGKFSVGPTSGGTATLAIEQGAVVSCSITNTAP